MEQRTSMMLIIRLNGMVEKCQINLSKSIYATSHIVSPAEIEHIHEEKTELIVIGTGQYRFLELLDEADKYFK
jgi:hypothetical protein